METKYKVRIVRGAFIDTTALDKLGAKTVEKFDDNWIGLDEMVVDLEQIKELQKGMVKHYDDVSVPWYMDGYGVEDKNNLVVAFGADDGEGGKIFQFRKDDTGALKEVVKYGIGKGIPKEQMDFNEKAF